MQKTLIIIPCYNEAKRLPYEEYVSFFSKKETIDFLFVNDGSVDNTIEVLTKLQRNFQNASILDLSQNVGKAEAIRSAMLKVELKEYEYIGYLDADLATPIDEVDNLIKQIERNPSPYLIMGSRIKILGLTDIQRKLSRHYIGRAFATVVSNMLKLPIYDTQCGAKLIKKEIVKEIFAQPFLSKWLFDVELLFRIKGSYSDYGGRIIEVPISKWEDKDGSKISAFYFLKAPFDLLKIFFHYY